MSVADRTYREVAVTGGSCSSGADPALALILQRNNCRTLLRATYVDGNGYAVTVAVAVFPSADAASRVKAGASGTLRPLTNGSPSLRFCQATVCQTSANAVGRYGILFLAGRLGNAPLTAGGSAAAQAGEAGEDIAAFVFDQLIARGQAEAVKAATTTSARAKAL